MAEIKGPTEKGEFVQLEMADRGSESDDEDHTGTEQSIVSVPDSKAKVATREISDPLWLGSCIALWYVNHNPLFTIGPHCKTR